MTGRAYALRLALVLFIWIVVIPGVVIGALFALERAGGRETLLWFFLCIPVWVVGFLGSLWRTVHLRVRALSLPAWIAAMLLVLLPADWRSIFETRRLLQYLIFPPFLSAALALLVALMFWRERAADGDARASLGSARDVAIWSLAIHGALAAAALGTSIVSFFTHDSWAIWFQLRVHWAGRWWLLAVCGSLVWAIVESRQANAKA